MSQVAIRRQVPARTHQKKLVEGTDQVLIPELEGTVATRNLWNDDAAATINVGQGVGLTTAALFTGANVATVLIGNATTLTTIPGSIAVQGSVATISTVNLVVADNLILLSDGAVGANNAGIAVERGAAGDDAIWYWNDVNDRFEFGLFDSVAGTVTPVGALATLADVRFASVTMAAAAMIMADTSLIVQSVAGDVDIRANGGALRLGFVGAQNVFLGGGTTTQIVTIQSGSGGVHLIGPQVNLNGAAANIGASVVGNVTNGGTVSLRASAAALIQFRSQGAGVAIPVQRAADTNGLVLVGFGAASIVGALNELKAGPASTYTNANAGLLAQGEVVFISGTDLVNRADATNVASAYAGNITLAWGFVVPAAGIAGGGATAGQIQGSGPAQALLVAGLVPVAGDEVFLSKTAGRVTTDQLTGFVTGDVRRSLGFVKNIQAYVGAEALIEIQIVPGPWAVVS